MADPISPEVRVFSDLEKLSWAAALEISRLVPSSLEEQDRFSLALAGGGTPRRLYELLATEFRGAIPWARIYLFWGDERCVPPDHPESNFRVAYDALISWVPIPETNVHRIQGELEPPERVAQAYERVLRSFFKTSRNGEIPPLDLVLLGVGEDGHTASLFPGDDALEARDRWVTVAHAPASATVRERVTLTLRVLNGSRNAFFLVSGQRKRDVVRAILEAPKRAVHKYPAAQVHPRGRPIWWVDRAALGLGGSAH